MIEGRCLCGAVRVRAERLSDEMSACFCTNCVRWGGGFQIGLDGRDVHVTGPVESGELRRVRITGSGANSLAGELI